jgi:hypothetical protein
MDNFKVTIVGDQHVSYFNPQGQVVRMTRVTIMVGPFGPFTHDFVPGQDSPAEIQTWIQNQKAAVVGLNNAV